MAGVGFPCEIRVGGISATGAITVIATAATGVTVTGFVSGAMAAKCPRPTGIIGDFNTLAVSEAPLPLMIFGKTGALLPLVIFGIVRTLIVNSSRITVESARAG